MSAVPVLDLFAGPGGLGEGFSALRKAKRAVFKIKLSIEKDPIAHKTLELRAFFRQFADHEAPAEYYRYLAGDIDREQLFKKFPEQAKEAQREAWNAELGGKEFSGDEVDDRIVEAIPANDPWVLIGGPPCQAYSLVGRSRRKHDPGFAADEKHFLYLQYLRILAMHQPPVFVMENVKGLLSAKLEEQSVLQRIIGDLENPLAIVSHRFAKRHNVTYKLFSLVTRDTNLLGAVEPHNFVVQAEDYGVPQARHRIILLGVRNDIQLQPGLLRRQKPVTVEQVLSDLPRLRSGLSKESDSGEEWRKALSSISEAAWFSDVDDDLRREMRKMLKEIDPSLQRGFDFTTPTRRAIGYERVWFGDDRLSGVCNHATRSHIRADIHRYFFVSSFARVHGRSPLLEDLPVPLLPNHKNVAEALKETKFNDRFRVQREGRPSTTVTSHISKDGHYFIHYDPTQCRSLTVREAARLQTFPDNYFFEGPRTQQYHQVGNAVPPFLAWQIAEIVAGLF